MSRDPARSCRRAAVVAWMSRYRLSLVAFAVALVPRVGYVLAGAGYRGTFRYDPSVYYAASASLLHGRLPYSDYTLLHPPGIALVLAPFAEFGDLTSDHKGFVLATLAFTVLGAINAALVVRVLDGFGLGARAALCGGLFYAVWVGAVEAEYLIRLEPLGNFLVLCALLALTRAAASGRLLIAGVGGAAFGAATSVKLWFVVPLLVVAGWCLVDRHRRRLAGPLAAGAAVSIIVICGVFFAAAPGRMWSMLVADQMNRYGHHALLYRLIRMSTVGVFDTHLPLVWRWILVVVAAALLLAICALAWRAPFGPLVVALLVAAVAVLAATPAYFTFYNDFVSLPLALAVGGALRQRAVSEAPRHRLRVVGLVLGAVAVATSAVMCIVLTPSAVQAFPAAKLASSVAGVRCVQSDSPMPLIELNVLSRDLDHDCPLWVDVSGRTFGIDAEHKHGHLVARTKNKSWQRDLRHYLFAGKRAIIFRAESTGIGRALQARLGRAPVADRAGHFTVLRTSKGAGGDTSRESG